MVISDIELPGISGLELGKRIKENNPDVYLVFLTSHSEFASESYIIEAYQYILKKDIEERLSPLIERVVHEIKKDYEEYRWVGTNQRKIKIYHKDIVCIQKIKGSKYAEYITENGKYMERLSMNQILEQIKDSPVMTRRSLCGMVSGTFKNAGILCVISSPTSPSPRVEA